MKLNVISDLHCGYDHGTGQVHWMDFEPERLAPADYLVVAGDTGYATTEDLILKDLARRTEGKFKGILNIFGNHSYWVMVDDHSVVSDADLTTMAPNRTIDVVDGDVAIIGTTLWTNSAKFSELNYMNDYRHIPGFSPEVKVGRFKAESEWLRSKWQEYKSQGKKVVIVTHHNPRTPEQLVEYSMEHWEVYTAYWTLNGVLDDIKPDLWICGHIHEDFDGEIDGVRFVRHPIGYRWGIYRLAFKRNPEVVDSWYNKVIEV